jgi:hypothetical protein
MNQQKFDFDFEHEFCPTCQARLVGRWERLTPGLCSALVKFFQASLIKSPVLHLQKDVGFTKSEFTNFQIVKATEETPGTAITLNSGAIVSLAIEADWVRLPGHERRALENLIDLFQALPGGKF